ncbi:MAG: alpha/beta fold hydrolase [Planctomycetaceae bacterium]|nr:alpha/beta fold hydrolase [Planctomycetaceae bacterium]
MTLPEAQLSWKSYGTLNAGRDNVILYPTSYGATHRDIEWLIGPDRILDPTKYFIIIADQFGNGCSTSPSNLPESFTGERSPVFTHVDNVTAQARLLDEVFGVERLALVYGWSMGAQQALHWGVLHPERVERIAALCGTAKTTGHNLVFLEGIRSALVTDAAWTGSGFSSRPERGLRALGRFYAGWALSQEFYREETWRSLGFSSLEDFLVRGWEDLFLARDAGNLLSMMETWRRSDVSRNELHNGDLAAALGSITARTLIMPGSQDLYFTVEDCRRNAEMIPGATLLPIPSLWGHRAGNPANCPEDEHFIRNAIAELLSA